MLPSPGGNARGRCFGLAHGVRPPLSYKFLTMQFPESWLREFCNPPLTTAELAETLTMAGLEVEELQPVAPPFTRIVVGAIVEVQQHPNADRLRVCQVDVGQGAPLTIVCGAPNARVGMKVPCAMVCA